MLPRRADRWEPDNRHHELPRHLLPLPPECAADQRFVFDPRFRRVIVPWERGRATLADGSRLDAVLDRVVSSYLIGFCASVSVGLQLPAIRPFLGGDRLPVAVDRHLAFVQEGHQCPIRLVMVVVGIEDAAVVPSARM